MGRGASVCPSIAAWWLGRDTYRRWVCWLSWSSVARASNSYHHPPPRRRNARQLKRRRQVAALDRFSQFSNRRLDLTSPPPAYQALPMQRSSRSLKNEYSSSWEQPCYTPPFPELDSCILETNAMTLRRRSANQHRSIYYILTIARSTRANTGQRISTQTRP